LDSRAACGKVRPAVLQKDPEVTTCQRCRATIAWQEAMSALTSRVGNPDQRSFVLSQEQHVDQQRNFTIREVLDYLQDWDDPDRKVKAHQRLMDGFRRQVRLAGLERAVREGESA
jgi:hypothetical protein